MAMMDAICCSGAVCPIASITGTSVKPVNISSTIPTNNDNLVTVTVPDGMVPGQTLVIRHSGGDGQIISADIPEGHYPGQKFDVRLPPSLSIHGRLPLLQQPSSVGQLGGAHALSPGVGSGRKQQQPATSETPPSLQQGKKFKLCSEDMLLLHNKGLVKIKVPPERTAGDRIRVKIPDGRSFDVVVPAGITDEFYLKVPMKLRNLHDNPIAVHAPMSLGPMIMTMMM